MEHPFMLPPMEAPLGSMDDSATPSPRPRGTLPPVPVEDREKRHRKGRRGRGRHDGAPAAGRGGGRPPPHPWSQGGKREGAERADHDPRASAGSSGVKKEKSPADSRIGTPSVGFSFPQPPQPSPFLFQQSAACASQPQPQTQTPLQPQFQFQTQQPQQPSPLLLQQNATCPCQLQAQTPPQRPFQFQTQQPQWPLFEFQLQPPQYQFRTQQPGVHQQRRVLFKVDMSPAGYKTKWEELHPESQMCLLHIEERILEYRSDSQRLDQCNRLGDSSLVNSGFEPVAAHTIQALGGINIAMSREKKLVQELMTSAKDTMRNIGFAIHLFINLHPRFLRPNATVTPNVGVGSETGGASSAFIAQRMASSVPYFYSGIPNRPSPFFIKTVAKFEKYLANCLQWIEVEQLLLVDAKRAYSTSGSSLRCLPSVLSNVHDYLILVAAKVENLHQYIDSIKSTCLSGKKR